MESSNTFQISESNMTRNRFDELDLIDLSAGFQ